MGKSKNDIERYLRGEMTPSEMHALEKEALQDPFLSEALEGISQAGTENFLFDLQHLKSSVGRKSEKRKPKIISMWNWSLGIAAGLVFLAVCSIYIISELSHQQKNSLALKKETASKEHETTGPTVASDTIADTSGHASQAKENEPVEIIEAPDIKPEESKPTPAGPPVDEAPVPSASEQVASQPEAPAESPVAAVTHDEPVTQESEIEEPSAVDAQAKRKLAQRVIEGKVISSEDGSALPGVNVMVKGTNIGTVTDVEGHYQIPVNEDNQTLAFAFIGMKPLDITPGAKNQVDVTLTPDYSQLSEVVVTGYGAEGKTSAVVPLELAEPQGGRKAFQQYLEEKMNYPEQALENKVEGRVTVQFTVGTSGQLEDFKILKGIGYGCDDEVIRLIKEGPAWSPSKRNARPVREKVKVRLKFDIPDK